MKKFFMGLVTGAIVFGSIGAYAASSEIKLIVNGKEIKSDIPTQIINGRTMIPLRALVEALDAKVEWDSEKRTVVVTTDDRHSRHDGSDDGPLHDLYDDNPHEDGHSRHDGSDDGPNHDLNDDHPHEDGHSRHDGSDDGPNHDADDDHGEHQDRDRDGRDD